MSNIDKHALREAAEKATPGVWVYLPKNTSIEYDYGSDDSQGSITYMDSGDFTQKQTDLNGAFIAAANPATVLALLDELEAKDKRIAEQRETLFAARSHVMQCARLGDAHANGVLQAIDRAAAGKGE
ncbi:ead/Ea22-like family protein [Enterobacter asburiae]|uniref:ead/Ea22-like family protein n=1 Tax=Enterobacter asburiae TaxID=61645 RepID=UPI00192B5189|nr:ead/Ea22-like family protein [Enterobacter asburiae]MBL5911259.1 ead/Ea22-like family protein [Enterobacter asburiae]